jgi:hydroxymethylglutaryl-CoA reductase
MVTVGIQKGHMALHAKNIALSAGVPPHLVEEVFIYISKNILN